MKKQVTVSRICSAAYIVLFQTALRRDPCSCCLSISEPIRPCSEDSCFRSFGSPSGCVSPIVLSDGLSCRSQPGESLCCLSSGSVAPVCCCSGLCLLGSAFDVFVVGFSGNWSWLVHAAGSVTVSTRCGGTPPPQYASCARKTCIRDLPSAISVGRADTTLVSKFGLRAPDHLTWSARGHTGIRITLSTIAWCALLNWITINNRLCAVRVSGSMPVNNNWRNHLYFSLCLKIIALITTLLSLTFSQRLFRLLWNNSKCACSESCVHCCDFRTVLKTQNGQSRAHFHSQPNELRRAIDTQVCSDYRLFLVYTNVCLKGPRRLTYSFSSHAPCCIRNVRVSIGHIWLWSIKHFQSFWSAAVGSDLTLACAWFILCSVYNQSVSHQNRDASLVMHVRYSFKLACLDKHPMKIVAASGRETQTFGEGDWTERILPIGIFPALHINPWAENITRSYVYNCSKVSNTGLSVESVTGRLFG